jgi:acetyltransferase-like isoleucine patch superfamily enzyme
VRFGDGVRVGMTVTPWTHDPDAIIDVGDGTFLNGTRFGCRQSIRIGRRSIVAEASIMDTDFHSTRADRHNPDAPVRVAPVVLGENVWVAANVGILAGTTIGDNSVVGYGAVVRGTFPADVIIAGNPAKVEKPIPSSGA